MERNRVIKRVTDLYPAFKKFATKADMLQYAKSEKLANEKMLEILKNQYSRSGAMVFLATELFLKKYKVRERMEA